MADIYLINSYATILLCFYLLAVSLKDARLKVEHPMLKSRWLKVALVGVALAHMGFVLLPDLSVMLSAIFSLAVLVGLAVMALNYRKKYIILPIGFVDSTAFLTIPDDQYVESTPGVYLRSYKPGGRQLIPEEKQLIDIANHYDLSKFIAVFFRIEKGGNFKEHRHKKREITYLKKGLAEVIKGDILLRPGHPFTVPPTTFHHFFALDDCVGLSLIEQ